MQNPVLPFSRLVKPGRVTNRDLRGDIKVWEKKNYLQLIW